MLICDFFSVVLCFPLGEECQRTGEVFHARPKFKKQRVDSLGSDSSIGRGMKSIGIDGGDDEEDDNESVDSMSDLYPGKHQVHVVPTDIACEGGLFISVTANDFGADEEGSSDFDPDALMEQEEDAVPSTSNGKRKKSQVMSFVVVWSLIKQC